MPARVATANETVASERATISAGTSAQELMERAGRAAADEMLRRFRLVLPAGVAVFTGPGNNGGDGWVVARCLAESGIPVTVIETVPAKTPEARAAEDAAGVLDENMRSDALTIGNAPSVGDAPIIVDALLGTGASGPPRDAVAAAIGIVNEARQDGAVVVALDVPSGLDATTGQHGLCVEADLTLTFGLCKRGQLLARTICGDIVVLDIGLRAGPPMDSLPLLVDRQWIAPLIPDIPADAHKGTRGRLAIIGGGEGMAGAAILGGQGALRSGIGLLRLLVGPENVIAIHAGLPEALAQPWPMNDAALSTLTESIDALAIGPGLGKSDATRNLVERVLLAWKGPVVVDADALNVFEGDAAAFAALLRGRPAVITPHPAELGRLLRRETGDIIQNRFEAGADFARESGAAVLLKGTPTVIFAPGGERFVSAAGTAALATGGSGDVLTGITATLLAQSTAPVAELAAVAAFIHGRAAELCGAVRGTTLDDVLRALPDAWNETPEADDPGVLTRIPAVP